MSVLWDILRCWVKEHPVKGQAHKTPGEAILAKEPKVIANWTRVNGAFTKAQRDGVTRYPNNPSENWGPNARAWRALMDGQHPGVEGEVGPQGRAKGAPPPEPKRRKKE